MQDLPWSVSAHLSVPLVGRHQLLQHLGEARQPEQVPEGHVVDMSWTCRGHVVDASWTCRGRVVGVSWTRLAHALRARQEAAVRAEAQGRAALGEEKRREEKRREGPWRRGDGRCARGGEQRSTRCLGRVWEVPGRCLRGVSEVSRRCRRGVAEVSQAPVLAVPRHPRHVVLQRRRSLTRHAWPAIEVRLASGRTSEAIHRGAGGGRGGRSRRHSAASRRHLGGISAASRRHLAKVDHPRAGAARLVGNEEEGGPDQL